MNALELRNEIIARRDRLVHGALNGSGEQGPSTGIDGVITRQPEKIKIHDGIDLGGEGLNELKEIRKVLERIEVKGRI
jgi:hypothetical protein